MQDSSMSPATQTNGRWTREEHDKFILGIQLYGKNWKKIEELIVTRTGAQIRSHAQKFFMKTQANDCAGVQGQENRPQPQPPQVREKQANKRGCPKQQKIPSICSPNFWYKIVWSLSESPDFCFWNMIQQPCSQNSAVNNNTNVRSFVPFQLQKSIKPETLTQKNIKVENKIQGRVVLGETHAGNKN